MLLSHSWHETLGVASMPGPKFLGQVNNAHLSQSLTLSLCPLYSTIDSLHNLKLQHFHKVWAVRLGLILVRRAFTHMTVPDTHAQVHAITYSIRHFHSV